MKDMLDWLLLSSALPMAWLLIAMVSFVCSRVTGSSSKGVLAGQFVTAVLTLGSLWLMAKDPTPGGCLGLLQSTLFIVLGMTGGLLAARTAARVAVRAK